MRTNIVAYGAIVFAVAVLLWSASTMITGHTTERYQAALGVELSDKCTTPPGYTDEQWRTHMGHHPDRYAECL